MRVGGNFFLSQVFIFCAPAAAKNKYVLLSKFVGSVAVQISLRSQVCFHSQQHRKYIFKNESIIWKISEKKVTPYFFYRMDFFICHLKLDAGFDERQDFFFSWPYGIIGSCCRANTECGEKLLCNEIV